MHESIFKGDTYSLLLLGNFLGNKILRSVSLERRVSAVGKLAIEF